MFDMLILVPIVAVLLTCCIIWVLPPCARCFYSCECCQNTCANEELDHHVAVDPENPNDPNNERYV